MLKLRFDRHIIMHTCPYSQQSSTQPFLVSALRDDIKKGCAEESYLSFVLNYKGKLYTEISLNRLILGRAYLKRTCNLPKRHDTKKFKDVNVTELYQLRKIGSKKKQNSPGFYTYRAVLHAPSFAHTRKVDVGEFQVKLQGSLRLQYRKPQIKGLWREQSTVGFLST